MYSSHTVPIVVRELLQNSVDACSRAGVVPEIEIEINAIESNIVEVTCSDNGCGMTPEQLVNDFLCLGGTSKKEGGASVGGFGIAKAAIMSGTYWKVDTLEWTVDSDDVAEGNEIRKSDTPREGTRVFVIVEEPTYYSSIDQAIHFVMTSDVDVTLKYRKYPNGMKVIEHAGLKSEMAEMITNGTWKGYGIDKISLDDEDPIRGRVFARMNGLTQFQVRKFYDKRNSNILIDIDSKELPTSKDYPMTVSREGLTSGIDIEVSRWISTLESESKAVDFHIKKILFPDNVNVIKGKLLTGEKLYPIEENTEGHASEIWVTGCARPSYHSSESFDLVDYLSDSENNPILKFINYCPQRAHRSRDNRVLSTWKVILEKIVPINYPFGIGLIGDLGVAASLNKENDIAFFLINPDNVQHDFIRMEAIILNMWQSACHEAAHIYTGKHDSSFVEIMEFIQRKTIDDILDNMSNLIKLMRKEEEWTQNIQM